MMNGRKIGFLYHIRHQSGDKDPLSFIYLRKLSLNEPKDASRDFFKRPEDPSLMKTTVKIQHEFSQSVSRQKSFHVSGARGGESYVWDEIGPDRLTDSGQHWRYVTVLQTTPLRETTSDGDKGGKKRGFM